jgi:hypothetical protein
MALEWTDVDLRRGPLTVERIGMEGQDQETKGMKYRMVPNDQATLEGAHGASTSTRERVLYAEDRPRQSAARHGATD